MDIEMAFNDFYRRRVRNYNWSLRDIDETNLETMFDFMLMEEPVDDSVRVIGGKIHKRAEPGKAPAWL